MVNKTFGLVFVLLQSLAYNLKTTFAGGYMFVVSMCRFDFRWHVQCKEMLRLRSITSCL